MDDRIFTALKIPVLPEQTVWYEGVEFALSAQQTLTRARAPP